MQQAFQSSKNIAHVIERLDEIVDFCKKENLRQGYFAVLYRFMTQAVYSAMGKSRFLADDRMGRLDVIFADRYLEAFHNWRNGAPITRSWKLAFEVAGRKDLTVFQHLLLGVNTHINLDLAIAAALTSPGPDIFDLQKDFETINDIIGSLTGTMQNRLGRIAWPMGILGNVFDGREKAVIEFSIEKARKASWAQAVALAQTPDEIDNKYISVLDQTVENIGNRIVRPGWFTRFLLSQIRYFEPKRVDTIIQLLEE